MGTPYENRAKRGKTHKVYKWNISLRHDLGTITGKFCSINELNKEMGLSLSHDTAYRLHTMNLQEDRGRLVRDSGYANSFSKKYEKITLTKINEKIV